MSPLGSSFSFQQTRDTRIMKKLVGLLLLFRALITISILVILGLAINATWAHLQSAQNHLSNAGEELETLAGNLEATSQNTIGIFETIADSADDIVVVLESFPTIPSVDTSLTIEIPAGIVRSGLNVFRIPTPTASQPLRTTSLLSIIEDNAEIEIPFASNFNTFRNAFNPMVDNLEKSFEDISLMGTSLDTVADELQLASNDLVSAATALNNLPLGIGQYLPLLVVSFIGLWLIIAFLADLQRGMEMFFG